MMHKPTQNVYEFRTHTIQVVSIICVALGFISIIIPIIYHVSPVSSIVFTCIALATYYLITVRKAVNIGAGILTVVLIGSSIAFSIIHGVYGSLGFCLMLFAAIISGLMWSVIVGCITFIILAIADVPLAIQQSASKKYLRWHPNAVRLRHDTLRCGSHLNPHSLSQ